MSQELAGRVFYLCDRERCGDCSEWCDHTSDIAHAVNFRKEQGAFFETHEADCARLTMADGNELRADVYTITIQGRKSPHSLTIPGRLDGLNEYTKANRTHHQKGAQMKNKNQELVMWEILAQLRGVRFTKPVFLLFSFYEQDRRRDRDNVSSFARKVIQDALVECGTLRDDGWDYVTGYMDRFEVDKQNPRIVVEFIEQEEAQTCSKQHALKSEK